MEMAPGNRWHPSLKGMEEWCSKGAPGPSPVNPHTMNLRGAQEGHQSCSWTLILSGALTPRLTGGRSLQCRHKQTQP